MVEMDVYDHSLGYIHHTGPLGLLNQHQSHQSLQYFTKILDDHDLNIICDNQTRSNANSTKTLVFDVNKNKISNLGWLL
jgi:hypothetical protein